MLHACISIHRHGTHHSRISRSVRLPPIPNKQSGSFPPRNKQSSTSKEHSPKPRAAHRRQTNSQTLDSDPQCNMLLRLRARSRSKHSSSPLDSCLQVKTAWAHLRVHKVGFPSPAGRSCWRAPSCHHCRCEAVPHPSPLALDVLANSQRQPWPHHESG